MIIVRLPRQSGTGNIYGNEQTAESRERDSAVTLFGPGDYCALTIESTAVEFYREVYGLDMTVEELGFINGAQ